MRNDETIRPFRNRTAAGQVLASKLTSYSHRKDVVVLALPRGGVPVAYEICQALGLPLGILVVRKLGTPGHEELAMGAIAVGGVQFIDHALVDSLGITPKEIADVVSREMHELQRRQRLYGSASLPRPLQGQTTILVDDGLATGLTMKAAVQSARLQKAARIVVAAGVGTDSACQDLLSIADEVVCGLQLETLWAIGAWYEDFHQVSDDEVRALLESNRAQMQPNRT